MQSRDFRTAARRDLKNNYFYAFLVCLLAVIVLDFSSSVSGSNIVTGIVSNTVMNGGYNVARLFGFSSFSGFLSIVAFIFAGAINVGRSHYFLHLADGQPASVEDLFGHFRYFGNTLLMHLMKTLYVMLWCLPAGVLLIGVFIFIAVSGMYLSFTSVEGLYSLMENNGALFAVPMSFLLIVIMIFCAIVGSLNCALAPYILAEHPEINGLESIKMSRSMMRGNKTRLFNLLFSFIGWYILGLLAFGVGIMFVGPYVDAAKAEFFNEVSGKNIEKAKREEEFRNMGDGYQPHPVNPYANVAGRQGCSYYHSTTADYENTEQ